MYNTIYPAYVNYTGVNNQIVKRKEDGEQSQSSSQAKELRKETQQSTQDSFQRNEFPTGQKVSIDYTKSSVNISQILTDFKNTAEAIGAPDDIKGEVYSYLNLIQSQSEKATPNTKIIQSNLKNASQILDTYITDALKKPSNVVENWIDALFLQKVDYKADPNAINEAFKVKIDSKKTDQMQGAAAPIEAESRVAETTTNDIVEENATDLAKESQIIKTSDVYIPQDKQLKRMFLQAKKFSAINEDEKSLNAFKQTLDYAKSIDDKQAQGMIYYEVGEIYDRNDFLPEAVKSYNKAIENTQDNNIKVRSHIAMAQIYDDIVEFEPATDHYFAAISFAGESENLNAQTKALTNLASMHCDRYDKEGTYKYLNLANGMAAETSNNKTIASTYRKSAEMSQQLEENVKALDYYKESTRFYSKANAQENVVKNYKEAAEIMQELGDTHKAKNLLEKAYFKSQSLDNFALTNKIAKSLKQLDK